MTKPRNLVDYCCMQRVGTLLDDFNKEIARTFKIHQAWAEIAGEVLAAHTEPVHLKGGTLTILCDAPLWAQQVGIMSASLCEQIRKLTGFRVKTCEGRFGRVRKAAPRGSVVRLPLKPAIDPRVIERINDPELKARVQALLDITEGARDEDE